MKKILTILMTFCLCFSMMLFSQKQVEAEEVFDISAHIVDITVNEDGTFDVVETIKLHFNEERHGIYVTLPREYSVDWNIDGTTVTKDYHFPIANIKVLSKHDYTLSYTNENVTIKLGNSDYYANTEETYKFSYTIVTSDLDLDGVQMVFLDVITDGWDTTTDYAEFNVTMPKDFDVNQLMVAYPGGYLTGTGSENGLLVTVENNVIHGVYDRQISADEGITFQLILDPDYFEFRTEDEPLSYGEMAGLAMAIIAGILFFIFGRDDKIEINAEYHIPETITPAEVGVIADEEVNDEDLISLILDWARRGLITIDDTDDGLILEKKGELDNSAHNYERIMFSHLFKKKTKCDVESMREKFYTSLRSAKNSLRRMYARNKRLLSTKESVIIQTLLAVFSFVPICLVTFIAYYFYNYEALILIMIAFQAAIIIAASFWACWIYQKRYVLQPAKKVIFIVLDLALYAVAAFMMIFTMHKCKVSLIHAYSTLCFEAFYLCCMITMRKRTPYGNRMLQQVLGLRKFIIDADKEKLQGLIDDNPYYFYDILPYAYALGLTNIWNEHFKNLTVEPCQWYYSDHHEFEDTYYMMHSLDSHMSMIQRDFTSEPVSSGSSDGGSSSGGDFSSGGGFGGSSGGSW